MELQFIIKVGTGWGGVGGWVGWSESDYNATLSSAKSLSVRTSVAKNIKQDRAELSQAQLLVPLPTIQLPYIEKIKKIWGQCLKIFRKC